MKLNRLFLFGTALSLAASGAGFAGGVAPANEPMVITTPSPAPAAVGYVELSFGTMTMQDENDGDFDGTPSSFSGQAFARLGENFALEIQSYGTTATDADDDDTTSRTYGVFGHYMRDFGPGTVGAYLGTAFGSKVDDPDNLRYHIVGIGYAFNGFVASVGYADHTGGDSEGDDQRDMRFLSAGYTHQFNDMWSVGLDGLVGHGNSFGTDDARFHELMLGVSYDLSETIRVTGSVTRFRLEDDDPVPEQANGTEFTLGLSIALGGSNSSVRSDMPFDAPNLHRPISWADEAF